MKNNVLNILGVVVIFILLGIGMVDQSRAQMTAPGVTDFALLYGTESPRQVINLAGGYIRASNLNGNSLSDAVYDTLTDGTYEADSVLFGQDRTWIMTVVSIDSVDRAVFACSLSIAPPGQPSAWDTTLYANNGMGIMHHDFPINGINTILADADEIAAGEQFIIGWLHLQYQ